MYNSEFEFVFDKRVAGCRNVLVEKAKEYASDKDRLHNFQAAAGLNSQSREEALWGMLTKHIVSLADMVKNPDNHARAQWDEKIGDALNYLFLLDAIREEYYVCSGKD